MSSSVTCCTVSVIYLKAYLSKGPTDLKQKGTQGIYVIFWARFPWPYEIGFVASD